MTDECPERERLDELVFGELSAEEEAQLLAHVNLCAPCDEERGKLLAERRLFAHVARAHHDNDDAVLRALPSFDALMARSAGAKRRFSPALRAAAQVLVAVTVLALFVLLRPSAATDMLLFHPASPVVQTENPKFAITSAEDDFAVCVEGEDCSTAMVREDGRENAAGNLAEAPAAVAHDCPAGESCFTLVPGEGLQEPSVEMCIPDAG